MNSMHSEDYIQHCKQNVYYCRLASLTFSPSSAGEANLHWYRLGQMVVTSGKSSVHAVRRVQIWIGTHMRIHSVDAAASLG